MAQQPADEPQVSAVELREQLRGKWQIPLLILSIGCFVAAVLLLVNPREPKLSSEKLLQRARAAFQAEDFASTIRLCQQPKTSHPRHTSAGAVYELQGDANYQLSRQVLANELDRFEDAVKICNVIIYQFRMDPCVMGAYVKLATAQLRMGYEDKARAVFERARWTLEKIPEWAFAFRLGEPSKPYWGNWIRVMQRD